MIPEKLPPGTTREQWEKYEIDKNNHVARIRNKREFMAELLTSVQLRGIQATDIHFTRILDRELSMDAPNEPGYYRANND